MEQVTLGTKLNHQQAMKLAIESAKLGFGSVAPNPPVGCVILDKNSCLISYSYHKQFGQAHAEVNALDAIRTEQLKDAVMYVTLEPCSHEGKTPSCAKALAKLPIKKVYYGLQDPNPIVSGKGIEILRQANINTEIFNDFRLECEELIEIFKCNVVEKKIFVAVKLAITLDGKMAKEDGRSKWISNEESRDVVHQLRAKYDATAVGATTFLIDDPKLNVRHKDYKHVTNKAIVFGGGTKVNDRFPLSKLAQSHEQKNIFLINNFNEKLNLNSTLNDLYAKGINSILIEGGAYTIDKFLHENLVNRLYLFVSPKTFGSGLNWCAKPIGLLDIRREFFSQDIMITGRLS